ncbi:MAG: hypothetical protein Q4D51_12140 [Eubacteriales bacterium]|nr:hypothetical protein [Eubacteriales bacterium]
MKKNILLFVLLFILIFFHNASITGAKNGLLLWYQVLIPSLLPFLLITNALSETDAYTALSRHFKTLCPNKTYEFIAIIMGNLCGYPIGGKIINDFIKNNYISAHRGKNILSFSSQASPMFLIGYVYTHILKQSLPLPIFLISIYLPIILYYPFLPNNSPYQQKHHLPQKTNFKITDTFMHAVQIMVNIGLYVMIFSIALEILLPFCHHTTSKLILSLFEITNGLMIVQNLQLSATVKIPMIGALTAFGGFCSIFQIFSVLDFPEIQIKKYLYDKCILCTGTFFILKLYLLFY